MLEFPPDQNDQLHSHGSTSSLPEVDLKKICKNDGIFLFLPNIREIHTNTFPNLGPKYFSTNFDTGNRGAWTNIPTNPQTLNNLRGTEIRYSWKKAEVANTMRVAVVLELPAVTSGL